MDSPEMMELSERAYRFLLEGLHDGTIRPGDAIGRRQLAGALKVSLAPVNDAVMRLEAEGFLEATPRRGTRVRVISDEELRGQLLLREALEAEAARLYCGPVISARRAEFEALAIGLADAELDTVDRYRLDMSFHRKLVELADCEVLLTHFRQVISKELFLAGQRVLSTDLSYQPADADVLVERHMELIEQLCNATPVQADEAIRAHIRIGRGEILLRKRVPGDPLK